MSCFLCGNLVFDKVLSDSEQDAIAYAFVQAAWDNRLHVLTEANLFHQDIVYELVGVEPERNDRDHLVFLVTASPIRNTSDELIEPMMFSGAPWTPPWTPLMENLERVRSMLAVVLALEHVDRIELCLSGKFDLVYPDRETELALFPRECRALYDENGTVPTVKFVFRKRPVNPVE